MSPPIPAPRVTIDTQADAAYLTLTDGKPVELTIPVADGCNVDFDSDHSDGLIVGVEFLGLRHGIRQPALETLTEQLGVPGWMLWETARYIGRIEGLPLADRATITATYPLMQTGGVT